MLGARGHGERGSPAPPPEGKSPRVPWCYTPAPMRSSPPTARPIVALLALSAVACAPTERGAVTTAAPLPRRVSAIDQTIAATVPPDLVAQAYRDAVLAGTASGDLRLAIERLPADKLIRLAGAAKDALHARGWAVEGEQHLEHAILVRLRRGGLAREPAERREAWWVDRGGSVYLCEGIARPSAFDRLGDPLRAICEGVTVSAPDPGPPAPDP